MIGYCYRNVGRQLLLTFVGCICFASTCFGQARPAAELKIPDAETISVEASDGFPIRCSYYPGGFVETPTDKKDKPKIEKKPGKEVVPVILLHGWEGRRRDLDELATTLQKRGHAVMVPDLRGHGDSTTFVLPNGKPEELKADRMRSTEMTAMLLDVEAAKKFLLDKNNAGELNIELLCVVGADVGSIVAVNWAAYDWSRRQLPAFKQGLDVKALVLVSPETSFKGYTLTTSLKHPVIQNKLSIMLVVGEEDRTASREAQKIYSQLERQREQPTDPKDRDLVYLKPNTTLQGTKLINVAAFKLPDVIAFFIDQRLVRKSSEFPWTDRTSPL